jgi:hypothetical protein
VVDALFQDIADRLVDGRRAPLIDQSARRIYGWFCSEPSPRSPCRNEAGLEQVEYEFPRLAREKVGENSFKSRHRDEVELAKALKDNRASSWLMTRTRNNFPYRRVASAHLRGAADRLTQLRDPGVVL